ncbi:MAG: Nif3-like dinuclear metal center hexameric protein [Ignavibacteriales bacterium]|nr:Nif3-like dinuclear metal center hexameric protein [Ignavibacteriales bacterium]
MTIRDIAQQLESWAPKDLAWEKDNVGLQVGDANIPVERILVALDVTENILSEAREKNVQLIISHHPLLFRPLASVTPNDRVGALVLQLIRNNIALYSAHTNLDFTKNGVSTALAEQLGLTDIRFLVPLSPMQKKVVVFVPENSVEKVAEAMTKAGGGIIGNYDSCSFRSEGTGTFRGNVFAHPTVGTVDKLESVAEVRLEMVAPKWKLPDVLTAMKSAHPYEEVAYDVYPIENISSECGMGAIGTLTKPMSLTEFIPYVKEKLGIPFLRYSQGKTDVVERVAVCGGSGSQFLSNAISQKADAYITADITYHTFHEAEGRTILMDAGHYETERHILPRIVQVIENEYRKRNEAGQIFLAQATSSAIHWQ